MSFKKKERVSSINLVDYDMNETRRKKQIESRIRPKQVDLDNRLKQCELGKEIFESGIPVTEEELLKMGYFVRQQYIVEKKKHEASVYTYNYGKTTFNEGKTIDEVNKIYQNNPDFLKGYKEADKINKTK